MIFLPLFNSVTAMVRCEGRRLVQSCLSGTGLLAQSAGHVASCSSSLWRLRGRRASLEVRGLAPVLVAASAAFAGSLIALSPGRAPVGNRRAQRVVAPAGPERSSFLASEIDGRRGPRPVRVQRFRVHNPTQGALCVRLRSVSCGCLAFTFNGEPEANKSQWILPAHSTGELVATHQIGRTVGTSSRQFVCELCRPGSREVFMAVPLAVVTTVVRDVACDPPVVATVAASDRVRRGVRARHRVTVTRYFRGRPEVDCELLVSLEGALSSTHDVSVVRHDTLPSTSSGFAAARYTIELAPEAHTTVCVPTDGYIVLRWPGTRELPPLQDVVPVRILQE